MTDNNDALPDIKNENFSYLDLTASDKPYSYEWVVDDAKKALAQHTLSGLQLGQHLLTIKQNEPHGRLEQAFKEIGVEPRSAQNYIKRFIFIITNPEKFKSLKLSDLNGGKQDALRKLPDVVLDELIDEEGTIAGLTSDEIKKLSTKEFQQALNSAQQAVDETLRLNSDLNADIVSQNHQLDVLEVENEQLRDQLKAQSVNSWPQYTTMIRMESSALGDRAVMAIDELERLLVKVEQPELDIDDPERVAHYSAAVISFWTNLRFIQARISRLIPIVHDSLSEAIDEAPEALGMASMEPEEIIRLTNNRNLLVHEFERDALAREAHRMINKPKRRRSKKAKAKS